MALDFSVGENGSTVRRRSAGYTTQPHLDRGLGRGPMGPSLAGKSMNRVGADRLAIKAQR